MGNYITKSLFMSASRCSKMAFMDVYKPEEAQNKKTTSLGTYFGQEARKMFKGLVTLHSDSPERMANYTSSLISRGFKDIAEASFIAENDLFCSCDIFRVIDKEQKKAEVYEVKSTTQCREHYVQDIAFQVYILRSIGWNIEKACIITVNSSYVNNGDPLKLEDVYTENDVTSVVEAEMVYLPDKISHVRAIVEDNKGGREPGNVVGDQCKEGFDCPYIDFCTKELHSDVFNLSSIKFITKAKLYRNGIRTYDDIIENASKLSLGCGSIVQAKCHTNKTELFDKDKVRNFIQGFEFPLYFLDFESFQMGLPVWRGTSAYMQIPFQYSLHKMDETGKITHMEFIGECGKDPRRSIAISLCKNLGNKGTILAYNSSFEETRIKELAEFCPDLSERLQSIRERIQDLMEPFAKRWIYKPAQNGSYSIKAVLPALYPNDPRLDYHSLDLVHNGTEAMTEYCRLDTYSASDRELTINALLRYCELDTYALVLVYEFLRANVI